MKFRFLILIVLFTINSMFSQQYQLSSNAEVSVLTIGPGSSLNDAFGHNAFRIKDNSLGIDAVYGYGQYDFDAPNFYLKFTQGKLEYLISRHNFADIYYYYTKYNRTIDEQILNFTPEEKQKLFSLLETNYKPENRRYIYDFFFDNCATRIRDVAAKATTRHIDYNLPEDFKHKTFRSLIHDHVGLNTWGSFGIDIALGSVIDVEATTAEHMFLPKYINTFFADATLDDTNKLVKAASNIYEKKETQSSYFDFLFSPLLIIGLISFGILFMTYKNYKNNKRTKWLDSVIFGITGVIGIVLLLLWFATDHSATAYNFNLLWAFPLNIIIVVQLLKPNIKNWVKRYIKLLIIMLALLTFHWVSGIQVFSIGLIPLLIALLIRFVYLSNYLSKQ